MTAAPGVPTGVLLEADGVVSRTVHTQVPPHVVYDIDPAERVPLQNVLTALCDWGLYWCDKTGAQVVALDRASE